MKANTRWLVVFLICCLASSMSEAKKKSSSGGRSKTKEKPIIYRLQVTGQEEFVLRKDQNPCSVLLKYCTEVADRAQLDFATVFDQLYNTVLDQLIKLWDSLKAHKDLKTDETLFVRCEPVSIADEMESKLNTQAMKVTAARRASRHKKLLGLLTKAVEQRDASALKEFNTQRPLYKLTDLERFELYRKTIVLLPSNAFMVDQFGLALMAIGRGDLARLLFENAVRRGVWGHVMQRPVSKYVKSLKAQPWHDPTAYPFVAELEAAADVIRDEYDAARRDHPNLFTEEQENLHEGGNWTELRLKSSGNGWLADTNAHFPATVAHLRAMRQDFTSVKFSSILPGTHIRPHTGPTNERLRVHLTLHHRGGARIRVDDAWHTWPPGRAIVFDDSWEHEVRNEGEHERTVLILDVWHPDLPLDQRIVH
ncbi:aspartyl/asparaginyl beta-hydroxylase-like [Sycon ciliatum]|uniref:aspartyl/asparaginyl beta-hydroxylase-like n=1 Tax=Sycon ciliatum TaxID=27933 RepID=UPI0031F7141B